MDKIEDISAMYGTPVSVSVTLISTGKPDTPELPGEVRSYEVVAWSLEAKTCDFADFNQTGISRLEEAFHLLVSGIQSKRFSFGCIRFNKDYPNGTQSIAPLVQICAN